MLIALPIPLAAPVTTTTQPAGDDIAAFLRLWVTSVAESENNRYMWSKTSGSAYSVQCLNFEKNHILVIIKA